jgi:hypothetical protein
MEGHQSTAEKPNPWYFPLKMNRPPGEEGEKVRHHLLMMLIFHLTFLILFEIWIYENFVFLPFIMQFVYIYLSWVGLMTLKKAIIYLYIGLMFCSMPLYFWQVIAEVGGFFSVVLCLFEMIVFFYAGGFITCRRLSFMNASSPGWEPSETQKNEFNCKALGASFKTLFSDPRLLKSNADGA